MALHTVIREPCVMISHWDYYWSSDDRWDHRAKEPPNGNMLQTELLSAWIWSIRHGSLNSASPSNILAAHNSWPEPWSWETQLWTTEATLSALSAWPLAYTSRRPLETSVNMWKIFFIVHWIWPEVHLIISNYGVHQWIGLRYYFLIWGYTHIYIHVSKYILWINGFRLHMSAI